MEETEKLLDEIMDLMDGDIHQKKDEIYEKLEYILNRDPLNKDALLWKGLFYQMLEDYTNAISTYEMLLQLDPNNEIAKDSLKNCKEFARWKKERTSYNTSSVDNTSAKDSILCKIPCELIFAVKIVILSAILCTIFQSQIASFIFSGNDKNVLSTNTSFKELFVNPPSELNNLRKDEVYAYRKAYVKDSMFATENYEPNEQVFGQIVDYKPWWGMINCQPLDYEGDRHEFIEGNSKQSVQINNPNALVGLSSPYIMWYRSDVDFCNADYSNFVPMSLKYNEKNNLIVAEYGVPREFLDLTVRISNQDKRYPMQLSGLNALDFGYKYVFAYDTKNIKMFYPNNVTENVEMFRDYIHLGGSCGYEGGCNNISPMQNDKMITLTDLPAEINLKLWKKQPSNKFKKADIYYRIIFKEIP